MPPDNVPPRAIVVIVVVPVCSPLLLSDLVAEATATLANSVLISVPLTTLRGLPVVSESLEAKSTVLT